MKKILFNAGFYFQIKGATPNSAKGIEIAKKIKGKEDPILLFVNDYHKIEHISFFEKHLETEKLNLNSVDYGILASSFEESSKNLLLKLQTLKRKKRAKYHWKRKQFFCSGFKITGRNEEILPLMLQVALHINIYEKLGFKEVVNIFPFYYEEEQVILFRLLKKLLPEDSNISTIFFNEDGISKIMNLRDTGVLDHEQVLSA